MSSRTNFRTIIPAIVCAASLVASSASAEDSVTDEFMDVDLAKFRFVLTTDDPRVIKSAAALTHVIKILIEGQEVVDPETPTTVLVVASKDLADGQPAPDRLFENFPPNVNENFGTASAFENDCVAADRAIDSNGNALTVFIIDTDTDAISDAAIFACLAYALQSPWRYELPEKGTVSKAMTTLITSMTETGL